MAVAERHAAVDGVRRDVPGGLLLIVVHVERELVDAGRLEERILVEGELGPVRRAAVAEGDVALVQAVLGHDGGEVGFQLRLGVRPAVGVDGDSGGQNGRRQ